VKEFFLFCFLIAPAQAMGPPHTAPSAAPSPAARQQPHHWRLVGLAMGGHQMLVIHALRASGAELNPEPERLPAQRRLDALIARTDALVTVQGPQLWLHMRDDQEESDCPCDECLVNVCIEPQPEGCFRLLTDCFRSGN